MPEENVEAMEHAADMFWQIANADLRIVDRGVPLADLEEPDDG